jgi:hypothetical protein
MADFGDTSSYPKAALPVSPLDIAGKIGGLQQQKLNIDQAKLDQANQGLTYMTRAMGALGPNAPKEAYIKAAEDAVKLKLVPAEAVQVFADKANAAPSSKAFYDEFMTTAADHQQQINYHIGQNKTYTDNKNIIQGVEKPSNQGGGFVEGSRMPLQISPGTPGYDNQNQQVFEQPAGPSGVVPVPRARPSLPAERPITGATGPTVDRTAETPTTFANRLEPLKAGPSPLFPEGKEAYTKAQLQASTRAQAIKPAIQALKLMPGLATGPGTGQFNDLVAAAKAWGIVDTKAENDPTVLRQEIEKKLAQYVGGNPIGQRSDAAQTLAEAGSPNPKKQILPALINLTRDAIALDRVQILKPNAFKGTDYQNYIKHEGNFPQSVDEKALTLDLLPTSDREALVKKMVTRYKNNPSDPEANKFLNTVKLAKEHGFFESSQ